MRYSLLALSPPVRCLSLAVFVSLIWGGFGIVVAQEKLSSAQVLPLNPAEILKLLPREVEDWRLMKSFGETQYEERLSTVVERHFEKKKPEGEEGELMKTTLSIEDTGLMGRSPELFVNFSEEKGEGYEKRFEDGLPMTLIHYGPEEFDVMILAAKRFVVRVHCVNQPRQFLGKWLKRIPFDKIAGIKGVEIPELPEVVTMIRLDELNPEGSRTFELAVASGEIADKESLEDDTLLEAPSSAEGR